jgi:hypothetical protein
MAPLSVAVDETGPEQIVRSGPELNAVLESASASAKAAGRLNIIFLYAPNRDHLTLVVGGEETVVGFNHGHGDPPYFVSRGAVEEDSPLLTAYVGLVHQTEFPRRWVVPFRAGEQAAMQFLATNKRPFALEWEQL